MFTKKNSKNLYIRILNFEGQAAIGSYLQPQISGCQVLKLVPIFETVNVHNNLHFYIGSYLQAQISSC